MVNVYTFADYVRQNGSTNACGHTTSTINPADFEKVGDLYDDGLGTINYINLSSANADQVYIGGYPYHDCEVLECKKCKQLVLFHLNHGWIAPRPEYFLVDNQKTYLPEPATKNVSFGKDKLELFSGLFPTFSHIPASSSAYIEYVSVDRRADSGVYNYREYQSNGEIQVIMDVVGNRETLHQINRWLVSIK